MKKKSKKIQKRFITDQNQEDFSKQKNPTIIILTRTIILWNLMQLRNNLREEYLRDSLEKKNR